MNKFKTYTFTKETVENYAVPCKDIYRFTIWGQLYWMIDFDWTTDSYICVISEFPFDIIASNIYWICETAKRLKYQLYKHLNRTHLMNTPKYCIASIEDFVVVGNWIKKFRQWQRRWMDDVSEKQ